MPSFSATSLKHLSDADPRLRELFAFVVERWDCSVIDGKRTIEEQRKNVEKGVSKTMESKHLPADDGNSRAVDVMPYPYNWERIEKGLRALRAADPTMEIAEVYAFIGFVAGVAAHMGIPLRQGADWNGNRQFDDHSFIDLPHHELSE